MFERFFLWSMRRGARILFLASLLLLLTGLGSFLWALLSETRRLAHDKYASFGSGTNWELMAVFQVIFTGLSAAAWPFFGAVLIYLTERHFTTKAAPAAEAEE